METNETPLVNKNVLLNDNPSSHPRREKATGLCVGGRGLNKLRINVQSGVRKKEQGTYTNIHSFQFPDRDIKTSFKIGFLLHRSSGSCANKSIMTIDAVSGANDECFGGIAFLSAEALDRRRLVAEVVEVFCSKVHLMTPCS